MLPPRLLLADPVPRPTCTLFSVEHLASCCFGRLVNSLAASVAVAPPQQHSLRQDGHTPRVHLAKYTPTGTHRGAASPKPSPHQAPSPPPPSTAAYPSIAAATACHPEAASPWPHQRRPPPHIPTGGAAHLCACVRHVASHVVQPRRNKQPPRPPQAALPPDAAGHRKGRNSPEMALCGPQRGQEGLKLYPPCGRTAVPSPRPHVWSDGRGVQVEAPNLPRLLPNWGKIWAPVTRFSPSEAPRGHALQEA